MIERRRLVEEVLDLLARPVHAAESLIDTVEKLRGILDRYNFMAPGWLLTRSVGTRTATLKDMLVREFGAVSSSARKLGSRKIIHLADELDAIRAPLLAVVDPPDDAGLSAVERDRMRRLLDDLRNAATAAAGRRRRVRAVAVTVLAVAVGVGFVLGLVVGAA